MELNFRSNLNNLSNPFPPKNNLYIKTPVNVHPILHLFSNPEAVATLDESYDEVLNTRRIENGWVTKILRTADACFNLKFHFENENENEDLFHYQEPLKKIKFISKLLILRDLYTIHNPLFMIGFDYNDILIFTKSKPLAYSSTLIYFRTKERDFLIRGQGQYRLTVNAYFVTLFYNGFVRFTKNEEHEELHFVAKKIQRFWRKYLVKVIAKRHKKLCLEELSFLPPEKHFPGGMVYQKAKSHFYFLSHFRKHL